MKFDLSTKEGRYLARKAGMDVPKRKPGPKAPEFWSLVDCGEDDECWNWTGKVNRDGYGQYQSDGSRHMAHRYAMQSMGTNIPAGQVAMHLCDNPRCCNPRHLALGTHRDNQLDKVLKDRHAKGEAIGTSILTAAQVVEIRGRYRFRKVTYRMLAAEYGVCRDTILKAIRCINWKSV